jgi:signal transduction histidine kinase
MKSFNAYYKNLYQISQYISDNEIAEYEDILVQIFTGIANEKFIYAIVGEIKSILPQAHIIGSTTAGEILNGAISSQKTVISFSTFEHTKIKSVMINDIENDFELGQSLARALLTENTKAMIIFGTLTINGSDMLAGVESIGNHFIVAGGHGGNNGYFKEACVFCADELTYTGVVGISLNSNILQVFNEHSLCWKGIGKVMTITRADKSRVYTIDGSKTRDIYEKYLGTEVVKKLPGSVTEFPLLFTRDGVQVARCPNAIYDDGSVEFIGSLEEGTKVVFSYGNMDMLVQRSKEIFESWCSRKLESIFVYSCTARHVFMQDRIEVELRSLKNTSVCGFFTTGEYYQTKFKKNVLMNITTTILGLSETETNGEKSGICNFTHGSSSVLKENFTRGKKATVIDVMNNLVNAVVQDLDETNRNLEIKSNKLDTYARAVKENQEVLIEREKAASLGHVISAINHNFKTSLTVISGGISLMEKLMKKMGENPPETFQDGIKNMKKWIGEVKSSSNHMGEIMNDANWYITTPDIDHDKFKIDELIGKINMLMVQELKKSKCKLETEIRTNKKVEIAGNINDLVQVLNVIISNSIDAYNGEGGIIKCNIEQKDELLEIKITDYGTGIQKDIIDKIFKEVITTKGKKGTGLGLYTAYSIIRGRFRGEINFHSIENGGTTFQITIKSIERYPKVVKIC